MGRSFAWTSRLGPVCLVGLLASTACTTPEGDESTDSSGETGETGETGPVTHQLRSRFDGLEGEGLVLRLGSESIVVTETSPLTLAVGLEVGDDFEVTVEQQPRWPSQTCVVLDGSGTVAGDMEITVECTSDAPPLDGSYGDDGVVWLDDFSGISGAGEVPFNLTLLDSGEQLVSGQTQSVNEFDGFVWRLSEDGDPVESFGDGGFVLQDEGAFELFVDAVGDGAGGTFALGRHFVPMAGADILVAHFMADGSLDPAFGDAGRVLLDNLLGGCPDQFALDNSMDLVQTELGLLITGASLEPDCEGSDLFLARLSPTTGEFDPTFATGGVLGLDHSGATPTADSETGVEMVVLPDGDVWIAGLDTGPSGVQDEHAIVWRIDSSGALVPGFASGGVAVIGEPQTHAWAIADAGDGVVVAGERHGSSTTVGVWRVLSDGSLDAGFGVDGRVVIENLDRTVLARRVALDSAGRVLVLGSRNNLANNSDLALWRMSSTGELDESFFDDGLFTWAGPDRSRDVAYGLAIDAQDRVYMSATTLSPDDQLAAFVIRVDPS